MYSVVIQSSTEFIPTLGPWIQGGIWLCCLWALYCIAQESRLSPPVMRIVRAVTFALGFAVVMGTTVFAEEVYILDCDGWQAYLEPSWGSWWCYAAYAYGAWCSC